MDPLMAQKPLRARSSRGAPLDASRSGLDQGSLPPRQSAAARLAAYAAEAERDRAPASWRQDGHYWNTAQSAGLLVAVMVVALILGSLLALVVEPR
jgi:hypothetical protein